jgi:hypothetical protein
MKKLIVLLLISSCLFTGMPNILAMIGVGSYGLGISNDDPLGIPEKLHDRLLSSGFDGELGQIGKPRLLKYVGVSDSKIYPNVMGEIQITVGEEEYIQKIQGTYLNTQHQNSPQKNTPTGAFMSRLWSYSFKNKPKFERTLAGQITFPMVKLGGPIKSNISAMIAQDKNTDVAGEWVYSEDSMSESMLLKLAD